MAEKDTVTFIITRQDSPDSDPYDETFHVPYRKNMNVISGLMEIQKNPVTSKRRKSYKYIKLQSTCLVQY